MTSRYRLWSATFVMVLAVIGEQGLRAELRVVSQVDVRAQRPQTRMSVTTVMMSLVPLYLVPGKADVVTIVARGQVRVEGLGPILGLDPGVVVLSKSDGETIYLLPASRTYFKTSAFLPTALTDGLKSKSKVNSRGKADVMLGQPTEKLREDLTLFPPTLQDNVQYAMARSGRLVPDWDLPSEERTRRWLVQQRADTSEQPITIESWVSDGFGPASVSAARSSAAITSLATSGFAVRADRRFALRQVITNPMVGYRVESRVTAVSPFEVSDEVFAIPEGYREVQAPALARPSR